MSVRSRLKTFAAEKAEAFRDAAVEKAEALAGAAARKFEDVSMRSGYKLDALRERMGRHVPAPPIERVTPDLDRSLRELGQALTNHAEATPEEKGRALSQLRREERELREESRASGIRPAGLVHNLEVLGFGAGDGNTALGYAASLVFRNMGERMEARKDEYANKPGQTPPLSAASRLYNGMAETTEREGFTGALEVIERIKNDPLIHDATGVSRQQLEVGRRSLLKMAQGKLTVNQVANNIDLASDPKMFGHQDFARLTLMKQAELLSTPDSRRMSELKSELKAIRAATPKRTRLANIPEDKGYSNTAKSILKSVVGFSSGEAVASEPQNRNVAVLSQMLGEDTYSLSNIRQVLQQGAKRNGLLGGLRKVSEAEKYGMTPDFCADANKAIDNILSGELPVTEASATVLKPASAERAENSGRSWAKPLAWTGVVVAVGVLAWYGSRDKPVGDPVAQQAVPTAPAASEASWGNRVMDTVKGWMPGKKAEAPVVAPPDKTWDIQIPDEPKRPASSPTSSKRQFNNGAASGASASATPLMTTRAQPASRNTMV